MQNLFTRDMPNEGMLWLARALESIPPDSPGIERAVRASLHSWHSRAKLVERTLSHGTALHAVVFSPDGRILATAGADHALRLWDIAKGGLLSSPIRHEQAIRAIAFSPDGRIVATASDDGVMRQWDAMTGSPAGKPCWHGAAVTAVSFSPDGSRMATASRGVSVFLWETETGCAIGGPAAHEAPVLAVAFHPDGTQLAMAGDDGVVRFWKTADGTCLGETLGHAAAVTSLTFSPDGRKLASGCLDGRRDCGNPIGGQPWRRSPSRAKAASSSIARLAGRSRRRTQIGPRGSGIPRLFDRSVNHSLIKARSIVWLSTAPAR